MFEKIISKIERHDSIVIFGHLNPDGDCYGSQIAFKTILKKHFPSKKIYAVGTGLPNFYHILGKLDEVSLETIKESLAVILDSNDLSRIEDRRVVSALDYAKIDHHIDNFTFVEGPEVISTEVTSTCELVYLFAKENQFEIPLVAAKALYLGILTDSARFQYATDYIQMFDILRDLISIGVKPVELTSILNTSSEKSLRIKAYIYCHYKKIKPGIIYVFATRKDREKLGVTTPQMTANTSLIAHIKKYPVWFVASESDQGGLQVEIRSNLINVQTIAASFGGGCHTFAAGFHKIGDPETILNELIEKLSNAIKEGRA
jgi:phosphoesterase RecJ-like protein